MNWPLFANSLLVASGAMIGSIVIGIAAALAISISISRLRRFALAASLAVLALPSFLIVNCWIDLLGVNGFLHRALPLNIFSLIGAVLILALMLWPIPALAISSAWCKLEPIHFEIDPAVRGRQLFRLLLWPAAKSQILLSAAVVFALALNNFAVPTILQVKVFTAEMWVQFNTNLDPLAALQLSWPLVLLPVLLLVFFRRGQVPWPRTSSHDIAAVMRRPLGISLYAAAIVFVSVLLLSLVVPLAQLAATPRTWSEFLPALTAGRNALTNSALYAISAAFGSVALALVFARMRWLGWMWIFFFVPGVLVGIAAVSTLNSPAFDPIARTAAIVVLLLILRYAAITRSMTRAAVVSIDSELVDAARLDGARGLTLFRPVILPQIAPQLAAGAYIVYLLALWDVETILLVIPPGGETLALRVFNLLHYGHNAHVNALCFLLLLLALAPLAFASLWKAVRR